MSELEKDYQAMQKYDFLINRWVFDQVMQTLTALETRKLNAFGGA